MCKFCYLLLLLSSLLLQSCQHNDEDKKENTIKEARFDDAAKYNTQLGLAYLNQGDRSRAKRKLLLALSQAPESPGVNEAMAYYMEKSGDVEQAEIYYHKAMSLSKHAGTQLNNYGTFLCRQGKYRASEKYFLKAVKDIAYDHTAGAYENAGLCVLAIQDEKNAAIYFTKALEQDPSRGQSLFELVKLLKKQDKIDEALMFLKKYTNLTLHNSTLLSLAIEVSEKAGKTEMAAEYQSTLSHLAENTGEQHEHDINYG